MLNMHNDMNNLIVVANTSPENIGIKQRALAMKNLAVIPSNKINHCMFGQKLTTIKK